MAKLLSIVVVVLLVVVVSCQDPASSWLSYASYSAGPSDTITALNASWKVPAMPSELSGSNAPGWWYGIQTAKGNGALIQPILAFGNGASTYTIFNGIFDWNDQSWWFSDNSQVFPGQTVSASVSFNAPTNTYTMITSCVETGWSVTSTKVVATGQIEATAYFVLEHQPDSCAAYPTDNQLSFTNITLEIENKRVTPLWIASQEVPACQSSAIIIDPTTIQIVWNSTGSV